MARAAGPGAPGGYGAVIIGSLVVLASAIVATAGLGLGERLLGERDVAVVVTLPPLPPPTPSVVAEVPPATPTVVPTTAPQATEELTQAGPTADGTGTPTPAPSAPPAATASAAPTAAPTATAPARQRLVIHGTGDVNLDPSYIPALTANGYGHAWSGLDGFFLDDSLTVINLECAVSDLGAPVPKEFNFRCDPAAVPHAAAAGVEVANLANNHSGDFGPEATVDSVTQVGAGGVIPVGVGVNAAAAGTPALFEVGGWRVAVVGFGGVVPEDSWLATETNPGMRNGDDVPSMVAAVQAAAAVSDLTVVTLHWGVELDVQPQQEDVARAVAMIDAGADVIFGHHSHRLQPLGWYAGRPIAWSLGNFVWPAFSPAGSDTAVAEVVVEPDGTIGACLIPATIVSNGHPALDNGRPAEPCGPAWRRRGAAHRRPGGRLRAVSGGYCSSRASR